MTSAAVVVEGGAAVDHTAPTMRRGENPAENWAV